MQAPTCSARHAGTKQTLRRGSKSHWAASQESATHIGHATPLTAPDTTRPLARTAQDTAASAAPAPAPAAPRAAPDGDVAPTERVQQHAALASSCQDQFISCSEAPQELLLEHPNLGQSNLGQSNLGQSNRALVDPARLQTYALPADMDETCEVLQTVQQAPDAAEELDAAESSPSFGEHLRMKSADTFRPVRSIVLRSLYCVTMYCVPLYFYPTWESLPGRSRMPPARFSRNILILSK